MKMIAAFDLSLTATGYAREAQCGLIRVKVKGPDRLVAIRDSVIDLASDAQLVVLEGYGFAPGRGQAARELAELGGVVRVGLYEAKIPFVDVAPASLKKFATSRGNAKKEAVLAEAIRRLDYRGSDHNEADALWLLTMAQDHYGLIDSPVPKAQREALRKIAWPGETVQESPTDPILASEPSS